MYVSCSANTDKYDSDLIRMFTILISFMIKSPHDTDLP